MFRFVHASDLHLGAAFEGIRGASPDAADALHRATYSAFDAVIRTAEENAAAFVVLAGDLCNRTDGNLRAELALRKAANRLHESGIATFIVYGNHDFLEPGRPDLDWAPSTCVFPADNSEPQMLGLNGGPSVFVYGRSYGRRDEQANLALEYPKPPADVYSVGVLHTACGPVQGHAVYAPCTLQDLGARGYDYWALGHVHVHGVLQSAGPTVVYSGNPQGLNPRETGPRGCCLVSVDDDRSLTVELRETDVVRWFAEDVDIGGLRREQDLMDRLEQVLADIASSVGAERSALVRISLVGRGPLHGFLQGTIVLEHLLDHLLEMAHELPAPVWTEDLRICTMPDIDLDARRHAEDFVGDFLRLAEEMSQDEQQLAGLLASLQQRVSPAHAAMLARAGVGLDTATIETVREWLRQAEILGADVLLGEER
jgi:DNA repair exonuclease SbcCD nuclease subunit